MATAKGTIHPQKCAPAGFGVKQRISDNFEKNPNVGVSQLVRPICLGSFIPEAVASPCGAAAIEESMCRALP